MSDEYIVVCECGDFERRYETHSSASAAQAGHASYCKGHRKMVFRNSIPDWFETE